MSPSRFFAIAICACLLFCVSAAQADSVIINWSGYVDFTPDDGNNINMTFSNGYTTTPSTEPWNNDSQIQIDPFTLNNTTTNGDFSFVNNLLPNAFKIIHNDPNNNNLPTQLAVGDISLTQLLLDINNSDTHATLNASTPLIANLTNLTLTPQGQALEAANQSPTLTQILNNQQFAFIINIPYAMPNLTNSILNGDPQTPGYFGTSFAASLATIPTQIPNPIPVPGALSAGVALFFSISLCRRRRK